MSSRGGLAGQAEQAERFEWHRGQLRAAAYRMLGSPTEAGDAVQEAWLRLSRADVSEVDNLEAWLRTVVSRLCLDMLRTRRSRREETLQWDVPSPAHEGDPEQEALRLRQLDLAVLDDPHAA